MKIYTSEQMRCLDSEAINEYGIDGIVLMENAAHAIKKEIENTDGLKRDKLLVVCGKGNNGGDGFAVARLLLKVFKEVKIAFFDSEDTLKGDAAKNFKIVKKLGIPIIKSIDEMKKYIDNANVVIDALYGFSFHGELCERDKNIVEIINSSNAFTISADLPSGVCADEGGCAFAVKADKTVTFTGYKIAQLTFPAAEFCGKVCVADIGIPDILINKYGIGEVIDEAFVKSSLPLPKRNAHKGSCGKVLIIGGSAGMSGAVCMSAKAALRSGAGLVSVALPKSINDIFEKNVTEAMSIPLLEDENGCISIDAFEKILEIADSFDTIIIGPGIGRTDNITQLLQRCLLTFEKNIVIDADALFALSRDTDILSKTKSSVIITPHYAEMGRLIKKEASVIESNSIGHATAFAKKYNVTIVLKGAYTVIASKDKFYTNALVGNQGMATGGSGDVLSGIIGALFCTVDEATAAACGVYIHALAGDMAKKELGMRSMLAGDISSFLPSAFTAVFDESL